MKCSKKTLVDLLRAYERRGQIRDWLRCCRDRQWVRGSDLVEGPIGDFPVDKADRVIQICESLGYVQRGALEPTPSQCAIVGLQFGGRDPGAEHWPRSAFVWIPGKRIPVR